MTRRMPKLTRKQIKDFWDMVERQSKERAEEYGFAANILQDPKPNNPWLKKVAKGWFKP